MDLYAAAGQTKDRDEFRDFGIEQLIRSGNRSAAASVYTAFPEFFVWDEASKKGYDVIQTDQMLEGKGLPLLTVIKNK